MSTQSPASDASPVGPTVYTATFTFRPGAFDDTFHALDRRIAEMARSIPGYLGEEAWENPSNGLVSNVYYWASMNALQMLIQHSDHLAAKQAHAT